MANRRGSRLDKKPVVSRASSAGAVASRLRTSDRDYLAAVSEAAFANPFSRERTQLDDTLVEASPVAGRDEQTQWTPRMLERLSARLRGLFGGARPLLSALLEHDRVLVENAIFFETFHRFIDALNAYIEAETASGGPLRVGFATELLRHLVACGIEEERAHRIFELFYQMARAHYFISRGLVGDSESMRKLREALWDTIFTRDILTYEQYLWDRMEDFSTILLGETGTGKGAAASAIGRSGFIAFNDKRSMFSHGFAESFVPINLNEFSETLFESEIFGHRKGAFTGAIDNYQGVLARCPEYGTVFLDEIGEATLPIQVKLLRVLQERSYMPVGSRVPERFSGRILAATHRSLSELREQGAMRDDFYYRLCSNTIHVPTLRQRIAESKTELPTLVEHLCTRIVGPEARDLAAEITTKVQRDLGGAYSFPGNVRELEQCVRRVLLTGSCGADTRREVSNDRAFLEQLMAGALTAEQLISQYCALLYQRSGSYVEVARITGLDRRTVKRHIES